MRPTEPGLLTLGEELWAIVGAAVGILGTGGVGWIRDRANTKRTQSFARRDDNRKLCHELLEIVDRVERQTFEFEARQGGLPGKLCMEWSPSARHDMVTKLEISCLVPVHKLADEMVSALDCWVYDDGTHETFRTLRNAFVKIVREQL